MPTQSNNFSKQVKGWLSKLSFKSSPRPTSAGKKDDLIPAKDKSPDDLEIME